MPARARNALRLADAGLEGLRLVQAGHEDGQLELAVRAAAGPRPRPGSWALTVTDTPSCPVMRPECGVGELLAGLPISARHVLLSPLGVPDPAVVVASPLKGSSGRTAHVAAK